jgi:hypothetical protein
MLTGVVPSSWLTVRPRLDAEYWLAVLEVVKETTPDWEHADKQQVLTACERVEQHLTARHLMAQEMRAAAKELLDKARELERQRPTLKK